MKKILVIHDEDRHLEEGRRKAATFVAQALSREFRVIRKPFGPELPQQIREADGVFSVAIGGRSDNLQAHLAGIIDAYGGTRIGPSAFAHALCLNKAMTKAVLGAAGIRVPRGILFQGRMLRECPSSLDPPFFVKPSREGSGIGVEPSSLQQDWQGAMEVARKQWHRFRQGTYGGSASAARLRGNATSPGGGFFRPSRRGGALPEPSCQGGSPFPGSPDLSLSPQAQQKKPGRA